MNNTILILQREFNERVRKKSFILVTLLTPILMIGLMIVPALIMEYANGDEKEIAVIDQSGLIAERLESDEELHFTPVTLTVDEARRTLDTHYGILVIGEDIMKNPNDVRFYINSSSSIVVESTITRQISDIIEAEKLKTYQIDNLQQILDEVHTSVTMQTFRNDKSQEEETQAQSSIAATAIGYILGFLLYMVLLLYGAMVMQSVVDEKSSRVLEVMVSSVRPFELMLGKILGIGAVAVTQLLIWGVLIFAMGTVVLPAIMPSDAVAGIEAIQSGSMDVAQVAEAGNLDPEMIQALATVTDAGYIAKIFIFLMLFMLGGFLFYSAMFAAVGSAVDNIQDTQQFQWPITLPIILSIMIMMVAIKDPNSPVAFWFSMIPFTSPVVMLVRIPYDIPMWEAVVSLVVLYASFIGMVWLAGKIYRVGIFMYGKKPTFKELYKWMKYKY